MIPIKRVVGCNTCHYLFNFKAPEVYETQRLDTVVFTFAITESFIIDFQVSSANISMRSFDTVYHHI